MTTAKAVVLAAALAVLLPSSVWANDRATFLLRNGQRETGVLAAHGSGHNNLIDGQLNLDQIAGGTGNASEKSYPVQDVLAIDFTDTAPSAQELARLTAAGANANALALRDGSVLFGRFDNIVNGDTVVFAENGQQPRQVPTSQVARVYLDLAGARAAYNAPGAAPSQAVATSGQQAGGIFVDGRRPWTDAGVTVRAGQMVTFQVSGQVQYARDASATAGPDGNAAFSGRHGNYPVRQAPVGALIGRIGNGAPFIIGSAGQPVAMPAGGRLVLGVNDDNFGDNGGGFTVVVTPQGGAQ